MAPPDENEKLAGEDTNGVTNTNTVHAKAAIDESIKINGQSTPTGDEGSREDGKEDAGASSAEADAKVKAEQEAQKKKAKAAKLGLLALLAKQSFK